MKKEIKPLSKINEEIDQIFGQHLKNTPMAKEVKDLVSQKFYEYAKEIIEKLPTGMFDSTPYVEELLKRIKK